MNEMELMHHYDVRLAMPMHGKDIEIKAIYNSN
jgi:hypothetical protein